jgi:hypothetical protein
MKGNGTKVIAFGSAALLCLFTPALSQSSRHASAKPHHHIRLFGSVLEKVAPDFSMVEVSLEESMKKENLVVNRSWTYDAFTVSSSRLFVTERKTGKAFEIRGLPLEWRPFSDLVWADNRTLVFDRWSQPHYGVHYAVNVRSKRVFIAAPFPDKFYLQQQRPKPAQLAVSKAGMRVRR